MQHSRPPALASDLEVKKKRELVQEASQITMHIGMLKLPSILFIINNVAYESFFQRKWTTFLVSSLKIYYFKMNLAPRFEPNHHTDPRRGPTKTK